MKKKGKNILYFVEGECEEKLVRCLIDDYRLLPPGKIKVMNSKQKRIPKSILLDLKPSSIIVFIFDTDVNEYAYLKDNMSALEKLKIKICTLLIPQVQNFEDEMKRCCAIKSVKELTHSKSDKDFKRDFIKASNTASLLTQSRFDFNRLWIQQMPSALKTCRNGKNSLCE